MNIILDIILAIPLIWALWSGFRNGIVVQLGGIAGLLIGVWLAFRYGERLGAWLNLDPDFNYVIGFILIVVVTVLGVALISRLLRGVFRFAGVAALDRIGGAVLSLFKVGLILGLLIYAFDNLNRSRQWVEPEKLEESVLYTPLTRVADFAFPYIDMVKEKLLQEGEADA